MVVGFQGRGELVSAGRAYPVAPGAVYLLPAEVGVCEVRPHGAATVLECGI